MPNTEIARIIPAIFTTAHLWTADTDVSSADLTTGDLPQEAVKANRSDWIWFNHNRSPHLRPDADSAEDKGLLTQRRLTEESVAVHRACGHEQGLRDSLTNLAYCDMAARDWGAARAHLAEVVAITEETRDLPSRVSATFELARVAREQRDYAQAERLLAECQALLQELDRPDLQVSPTVAAPDINAEVGRLAQLRGDTAHASPLLREAVERLREPGSRIRLTLCLHSLGALALAQGNPAEASGCYRESLQLAADVVSPFGVAVGLAGLAEVARRRDELEKAARLGGAAAARGDMRHLALSDFGRLYLPTDWLDYDRTLAALSECRGDPAVDAAWVQGQAMTFEQAVEYALRDGDENASPSGKGFPDPTG